MGECVIILSHGSLFEQNNTTIHFSPSQWKLKECLEEHTRKRKRKVPSCCEGQGSAGRREHTGSAGSKAPSVPKMGGRDGNTNTSTATKRAWIPRHNPTHTPKNTGWGIEKAKGGMEWKVTDTWVMR